MGNSRSRANSKDAGRGGRDAAAAAAAAVLDESRSSKNGKKNVVIGSSSSSCSGSKKSCRSKTGPPAKDKTQRKANKKQNQHQQQQQHPLIRQDSYTKAIMQHEQQLQEEQAAVLQGVGVVTAAASSSSTARPVATITTTPTRTRRASTKSVPKPVVEPNVVQPPDVVPQQPHDDDAPPPQTVGNRSMHASLVRGRDGSSIPVHQIYDIIDEIGHGGLCKVFCIQKKQDYIGGSSRPQHVIIPNNIHNNSSSTVAKSSLHYHHPIQSRWFKKLQALGTITIRAPASPALKKEDAAQDDVSSDPWNSPELRFLFHHQHRRGDSLGSSSSSTDDNKPQGPSTTTTTAPAAAAGDIGVNDTVSTTSLTADTTATTHSVTSQGGVNSNASSGIAKPMYFALKVINLVMVQEDKIAQLKNEVEILKTLDHPNIIKVYETFNTKRQVMMIMELCTGGDLHARMPYTECQVADIVRQILIAIRYIHARHIVHRDCKMENIMFESTHPQAAIKVIDFGLSKNYSNSNRTYSVLTERVGTLYSMSPETMRGIPYASQADLWSIGVVSYILLANGRVQPFEGKNPKQVVANVLRGRYSFDNEEIWGHVSQHAKDFISNLLVLEPERRMTASTAREHEWFAHCKQLQECQPVDAAGIGAQMRSATNSSTSTAASAQADVSSATAAPAFSNNTNDNDAGDDAETSFQSLDTDASRMEELKSRVCTSLVEYADMGEFRKLALNVIAKKSSSGEIFELRKVFQEFDYLNTGTITLEEFSTALSRFQYSPQDIHKIFTKIDVNRDNVINYTEFLAAALETQGTIEEYRLAEAFDLMDDDDSGFISHENLRKILPRAKYSDAYVDQLIAEGDFKGDGVISYEEFLQVFANKKHDRIRAIHYESTSHADGKRNIASANGGGEDDGGNDDDESDSNRSTDDILRRYGIIQSLRRGFGSTERLVRRESHKARSRILSSDENKNATTTKNDVT